MRQCDTCAGFHADATAVWILASGATCVYVRAVSHEDGGAGCERHVCIRSRNRFFNEYDSCWRYEGAGGYAALCNCSIVTENNSTAWTSRDYIKGWSIT